MKAIHVYDNGGETFDRYTILIGMDVFTMSEHPMSPQGSNQFSHRCFSLADTRASLNETDTEINFNDLSSEIQEAIKQRMEG